MYIPMMRTGKNNVNFVTDPTIKWKRKNTGSHVRKK